MNYRMCIYSEERGARSSRTEAVAQLVLCSGSAVGGEPRGWKPPLAGLRGRVGPRAKTARSSEHRRLTD